MLASAPDDAAIDVTKRVIRPRIVAGNGKELERVEGFHQQGRQSSPRYSRSVSPRGRRLSSQQTSTKVSSQLDQEAREESSEENEEKSTS